VFAGWSPGRLIANGSDPTCLTAMVRRQCRPRSEQLTSRARSSRADHFVMAKRMVARHRYEDWIVRDSSPRHRQVVRKATSNCRALCGGACPAGRSGGLPQVRLSSQAVPDATAARAGHTGPTVGCPNARPDNGLLRGVGHPTSSSASTSRRWAGCDLFPQAVASRGWLRLKQRDAQPDSSSLIPPLSVDA